MIRFVVAGCFAVAMTVPVAARVFAADPHNLEIEHRVSAAAPPGAVYAAIGKVSGWWSKDHTYSGNADNLSLSLFPGGCFCERLPGGGAVEHLRVSIVQPGKQVVLSGALGPMLYEGVAGVMQISIEPNGGGSTIIITYRGSGFVHANADKLAPVVDRVLGEQAQRLARFAAGKR